MHSSLPYSPIIHPVVALIAWTMIMWIWMYATRLPAVGKIKPDFNAIKTGKQLREVLPERTNWVADNYNHLLELPVVFYAVCFALAFMGMGGGLNLTLAWAYVGLRVMHSLWQCLVNAIPVRFVLFALSSLVLMALALHAAIGAFY
jgi:hypothetical protein